MTDVNLNNPGLKLVSASKPAPGRDTASPQAEGRNASDQTAMVAGPNRAQSAGILDANRGEAAEAVSDSDKESLDNAVSKLNDFVQNVQRDLQFEVDNELGETIVKVVDQETQEVIRQIPDEVAVRLAEKLQQDEPLTLFNIEV
ncbi:MAG: flagellar protein FlaG [Marinobacter sp.]|uniref:flagellar protein FlaG n=1 Tax=Marinobacter sp. TaxID=50741 RepID=UPI00299D6902|nr:flagellar protein FlaG [Marinobacter sp.]MDX1754701.1 flagellar protein FlaG [Marinobacter sp.]